MLNDLNNYKVLYIPIGGLAGCWLYHGLYNKFQSIFKLNILDYNFYINIGTLIGLSIGTARYYANEPLLYYITEF
tara:strand:- start:47601 stop:47825 length:225 start_codon:yes stop_codon:yes gene_type:complete